MMKLIEVLEEEDRRWWRYLKESSLQDLVAESHMKAAHCVVDAVLVHVRQREEQSWILIRHVSSPNPSTHARLIRDMQYHAWKYALIIFVQLR